MDERLKVALDEVEKLAKGGDLKEIRNLVERFDEAIAINDRKAREISKEAFRLEKAYVPQMADNQDVSQKLRCENMIMTVGFQKEPIILSILCMKPHRVILLHTDGSRPTALDVENDPDIKNMNIEITPLFITEYDASQNYRIIKEQALTRIPENESVIIDPTGGRKVMVASLALVAFYMRFRMVYIHGVEQEGIIFPFTERLRVIENPFEFFGDTEFSLIQEQFNDHLYEAAFNTCEQLKLKVRDAATHTKVEYLQKLVQIYLDWDSFLHSSFPKTKRPNPLLSARLKSVLEDFKRLGIEGYLPDNVYANLKFLKEIDRTWREKKNIIDEFRLVDIFSSSLRRADQKKYDDAVGRLYRCLEMCSTIKLLKLGLKDTAHPDFKAFGSRIQKDINQIKSEYEGKKHRQLPDEMLGLDVQMTLLDIAGDNIGSIYESMRRSENKEDSLMDIRNRSILAHGTNPIPEDRWPDFKEKTEVIIRNAIGKERFQELLALAMHGKIMITK